MKKLLRAIKARHLLLLLLLIVITGSFFRFWGMSSVYQRVDDIPLAKHTARIYQGNWKPNPVYYYPLLFNYITAIGLRCLSGIFRLMGMSKGPGLFPFTFDQILLAARLLSAFLGSLTIILVYAIGKRLYSAREGLLASFFFSVSFIHILYSHQIVLDVPMTFFYALALYFCALLLEKRRWKDYVLAGFLSGLAIATKYNGIFIVFSILLAHILGSPPVKRKVLKAFLDAKLYLAGLAVVIGFFIAHPYAIFHFKTFLRSSSVLIGVVHETEYYLKPIQPKTAVDILLNNKYFLALKNILMAEGPVFLALIILGIICVLVRRSKKKAFLAFSGLAYFLGALGFLGFSRLRDIAPLALFYSFLGMLGVGLLLDVLKKPKAAKISAAALVVLALAVLEYSALAKTYCIWENDTTEVAERWVKRNIPEGTFFGKEWFSPPLQGKGYHYPSFSAPFLFFRGFAPYERFDFIITSSAANGHFFRNEKFYPGIIRLYRSIELKDELVKNFYFKGIEYKNPELNIYSTKSRIKKRQRLSLPPAFPPENPAREFEMIDGSPYGKSINGFFLGRDEKVKRIFISRKKIRQMAVFVSASESDGEIMIKNFLWRKKLQVKKREPQALLFRPRLSFPFYRNISKITIQSDKALTSAFVKLCYDDFDIALEFFAQGNFESARKFFLKALAAKPPAALELEVYFYLAFCSRRLGLDEEAKLYLKETSANPLTPGYKKLLAAPDDEKTWPRTFERFSGLDYRLLEKMLTIFVDDAEFQSNNGKVVESRQFHGSRALQPDGGSAGDALHASSPEKRYYPQDYLVELEFYNPSKIEGPVGELEIVSSDGQKEGGQAFPIILAPAPEGDFSSSSFRLAEDNFNGRVRFILKIAPDKNIGFDYLKIIPDIKAFFDQKKRLFQEFLDGKK
jgi:4-amino-4-deoxy-L-arabinose transferase-like glycosyltransferase